MIGDDHVPNEGEIRAWLLDRAVPEEEHVSWARALHGMPWRYIRPLVTIATTTKVHPVAAMAIAARYSVDPVFTQAVRRQVERLETGP
ncbi:MAG: hypothetical protein ACOCUN_00345 [Jiangellaceae bacterium]